MSDSYYGRPIVKPHPWKPFIPWYFWIGGMAGAASVQSVIARAVGLEGLARAQKSAAFAGALVAPALLIADLGVPQRFANMFRVFKPTSPMSVGSWALGAFGGALTASTLAELIGWNRAARTLEVGAAVLGPFIATYTSVLIADTATPIWHEAHDTLPFVFAANAIAAGGAAGTALAPSSESKLARRLMIGGAFGSVAAMRVMEHRLGTLLAEPYHHGKAGSFGRAAEGFLITGGAIGLLAGRWRPTAIIAAACVALGGVCERFAVSAAGKQSAEDPKYVVKPQRERLRQQGRDGKTTPRSLPDRVPPAVSASIPAEVPRS